ncbi:MAG: rod shape-determining protein MreD [Actinomycetota bacterium]
MSARSVRIGLVVSSLLALQLVLFNELSLGSVHPDLVWTLPLAAGLLGGARFGALFGFGVGLLFDLSLPTPFGLTALVCCLVGAVMGKLAERGMDAQVGPMIPVFAALSSAGALLAYPLLAIVIGNRDLMRAPLLAIVAVVAFTNALLAVPVVSMLRWAGGREGFGTSLKAQPAW